MKRFIALLCVVSTAFLTASDTLVVGTNAEFPPFTTIENGQIVGFDIDIAKEVTARLGKKIEFKDMPFEALIPDVVFGYVDFVAAGMSYTAERAQRVLFTKPYLAEDPLVILTAEKTSLPLTLDDLIGKTVAVNEGFTADTLVSGKEGIAVVRLATISDAFLALKSKRVFAFVTARSTYETFLQIQPNQFFSHELVGTSETCALVVPKSKPELLVQIQTALDAMQQDGTIAKLKSKWGL
jgi:ABC-type amino acid transport substrate-binding protein